ncbi:Uncharacterised protein [Mycobacteroides abscessus subsp. abscessus]|uniref:hypothetical protein n=1 Tax=Rothia kristinae TaxID=37923 RepID=UPI000927B13C|nr:hypothetical protein [Rothia kristinae]SIM43319.1 Uncharacterised protein [Mycobacteroides abscessus subsp. abscessus]
MSDTARRRLPFLTCGLMVLTVALLAGMLPMVGPESCGIHDAACSEAGVARRRAVTAGLGIACLAWAGSVLWVGLALSAASSPSTPGGGGSGRVGAGIWGPGALMLLALIVLAVWVVQMAVPFDLLYSVTFLLGVGMQLVAARSWWRAGVPARPAWLIGVLLPIAVIFGGHWLLGAVPMAWLGLGIFGSSTALALAWLGFACGIAVLLWQLVAGQLGDASARSSRGATARWILGGALLGIGVLVSGIG